MGYWKNYLIENGGVDRSAYESIYVCQKCLDDKGLKQYICEMASADRCDYCGSEGDDLIAISVADLARHLEKCLLSEYDDAANHLPREGQEGGYLGEHWDTYDLLSDEVSLSLPNDDGQLFDDLRSAVGDRFWSKRNPFALDEHESLNLSWEMFCEIVKHRSRFLFWRETADSESELLPPAKMLEALGEFCRDANLVTTLPARSRLFRARRQPSRKKLSTVSELGPPPQSVAATSNRMSPAGIVMFYASQDSETALRETAREPCRFVVAEFETMTDVSILNLTVLPEVPSLFELDKREYRSGFIFLRRFVNEFSKPIAPDRSEPVDYVPTQIVTEYFRSTFQVPPAAISGIRYPSAQCAGGSSLVLFADQNNFVNGTRDSGIAKANEWLRLVGVQRNERVTAVTIKDWKKPNICLNFADY
jgi:hypothetical protein